jgi:hypothetical protein
LLLTAGRVAGLARPPRLQAGEVVVDLFQRDGDLRAARVARERAGQQIFLHGEVLEAMPSFHDLAHAHAHELVGGELVDALAPEFDRALGHIAALGGEQVGDRLQRGALASAVRAEQRHDPALGHFQRYALQHQDHVVVNHLDVVHRKIRHGGTGQRGRGGGRGSGGGHGRCAASGGLRRLG